MLLFEGDREELRGGAGGGGGKSRHERRRAAGGAAGATGGGWSRKMMGIRRRQQCSVRLEGSIEPVDASKSSTALGWAGEVSLLLLFPGVRHGTYQPPVVPMPSLAGVICR